MLRDFQFDGDLGEVGTVGLKGSWALPLGGWAKLCYGYYLCMASKRDVISMDPHTNQLPPYVAYIATQLHSATALVACVALLACVANCVRVYSG